MAASAEIGVHGRGELERYGGGDPIRLGGLPDGGEEIGPLLVEPMHGGGRRCEGQATARPATVEVGQTWGTRHEYRRCGPGSAHVEAEHALGRGGERVGWESPLDDLL